MSREIVSNQVTDYFLWLKGILAEDSELYKSIEECLGKQDELFHETDGPFLTVITRTQGNRPEMLTEVLLCMTGQTNTNFEILIMGHNLSAEDTQIVNEIIHDLPDWIQKKVRLIPVYGGGRATPLNRGFEEANGQYCVVLDDDDIVFEHWVEEFYQIYLKERGRMLRTYMVTQEWSVVYIEGKSIPRAYGEIKHGYCREFNILEQLRDNYCPQGSVAYPSYIFKKWGIRFDEGLSTLEDWDFLMKVAFLAGVSEAEVVTAIYRNWKGFENSQTIHDLKTWTDNTKKVKERWKNLPLIVPSRTLNFCSVTELDPKEIKLYYDNGNGICEENSLKGAKSDNLNWLFCFSHMSGLGEIEAIRFDPFEHGDVFISNFRMKVFFTNGTKKVFRLNDIQMNGILQSDGAAFLKSDPWLFVKFEQKCNIHKIYIFYTWENPMQDNHREIALDHIHHSRAYRDLRKIWHRIKR